MEPDRRTVRIARRAAQLCAVVAGGAALIVAVGWLLGEWTFATFGSGYIPMAPSTAWLLLLLGGALFILARWPDHGVTKAVVGGVSAIVAVVGVVVGICRPLGFTLPLEMWLARTSATVSGIPVGQMSAVTAATFVAAGLALGIGMTTAGRASLLRHVATALAMIVLLTGLVVTLDYVLGGPPLYNSGFIPMALLTALTFIVLGAGLLVAVEPEMWLLRLLVNEPAGGVTDQLRRPERLMLGALVVLIAGIGAGWLAYTRHQLADAERKVQSELEAVADLKVQQISRWRQERLNDATFVSTAGFLAHTLQTLLNDPSSETSRAELSHWLDTLRAAFGYQRVALFDPDGNVLLSAPPLTAPARAEDRRGAVEGLHHGHAMMSDLHRSDTSDEIRLDVTAPIFVPPSVPAAAPSPPPVPAPQPIALLLLQIDPTQFLYPLLQSWPMPSETAETSLGGARGTTCCTSTSSAIVRGRR